MNKAIVIGASGQLGQCLQAVVKEKNAGNFIFLSRKEADIADEDSLRSAFTTHAPAYCINCAAYTAVDKAEDEPEVSRQINRDGVISLSKLCREFGTTLIHISTDFVFSGNSLHPLSETDDTAPVNIYGATKLEGEQAIPGYIPNYFILRTSWLYSEFGNNFVKTMLRLGREKDELRVIWDQIGTPTYAMDLAEVIFHIIETNNTAYGIYHYSNEGLTSWYDFAKAIFELSHIPVRVVPVRTSEYITKAKRPAFSVLEKTKAKQNLGIKIPHWRESLKTCLSRM
ncbi:dTDP-4-dehydrorhamnose reductase [Pontibacter saemangeumensis]|uniref:dTDP-4-dehydrorhamnose reductase n=1 Tax=Pontibacter saemangeumensis TaxID=1084525 RepID=A0ABP8L9P5_9BACT